MMELCLVITGATNMSKTWCSYIKIVLESGAISLKGMVLFFKIFLVMATDFS